MALNAGGALTAKLVARSQAAEEAGVRNLVEVHFAFVARSLRRLGAPEADVDDAVQRVFLTAASKLEFIRPGSEKSFLLGVALRVASDMRRAQRRRVTAEAAAGGAFSPVGATPEELAGARQARALLDRVLDAMPMALRTVFILFELESMTMAEIAPLLELAPGTVASRLRRARQIFQTEAARLRVTYERQMPKP